MFTRTPSKLLNGASQSDGRGGDLGLQAKVETKGKQVWSDSELREEKRPGLGHKERFVLADSAGLGQASLGSVSRKYFHCLIPGHRIVIRRYRTLNAFTG